MKLLLALSTLFILSSAHASYFATHCSNSRATVKWASGHNTNTMTVTIYGNEDKDVIIPLFDVKIDMASETVIHQESIRRCGYASFTKVYAAKVVITPSEQAPNALDFIGESKKIETEVICTTHRNGRAPCPEEPVETIKK